MLMLSYVIYQDMVQLKPHFGLSSCFLLLHRSTPQLKINRSPCYSSLRNQTPKPNLSKTHWPSIALSLFGSGFFVGPLIDGLHSRVGLVVYRNGSIDIGPLHTNIWVPGLLGLFYCTIGSIQLLLDERVTKEAPKASLKKTIVSLIALVVFIELSAEMYKSGVGANVEAYALFALAEFIWYSLDRTWLGFTLACLVGIACPLAEIPIIKLFHLWDYPQANIVVFGQGIVSWTVTCYFVYVPFLTNLSRLIKSIVDDGYDAKDNSRN